MLTRKDDMESIDFQMNNLRETVDFLTGINKNKDKEISELKEENKRLKKMLENKSIKSENSLNEKIKKLSLDKRFGLYLCFTIEHALIDSGINFSKKSISQTKSVIDEINKENDYIFDNYSSYTYEDFISCLNPDEKIRFNKLLQYTLRSHKKNKSLMPIYKGKDYHCEVMVKDPLYGGVTPCGCNVFTLEYNYLLMKEVMTCNSCRTQYEIEYKKK